jgi:hypothetical protein
MRKLVLPVQPKVASNHEAIAPYNFIPLPEMVITFPVSTLPDQGVFDPKRHTGYIDHFIAGLYPHWADP